MAPSVDVAGSLSGAHGEGAPPSPRMLLLMAFNEDLTERVRHALGARAPFTEIKMFGGLCFTVKGNMAVGVVKDDLMVRVGADQHDAAVALPGARPMDFAGKPMNGFVYAGPEATDTDDDLQAWVDRAFAYVGPMPPKKAKPKTSKPKKARPPSRER